MLTDVDEDENKCTSESEHVKSSSCLQTMRIIMQTTSAVLFIIQVISITCPRTPIHNWRLFRLKSSLEMRGMEVHALTA